MEENTDWKCEVFRERRIGWIYPLGDIFDHTLDDLGTCVCRPVIEERYGNVLVIHRSFDERKTENYTTPAI